MKIKEMIYDYLETNHGDLNKMEEFSEFICDYFKKIKEENKYIYYDFKKELDTFTFEIDEDIIEEAILHLERKDGKEGKKWEITDTDGVAKQYGIFEKHPELDPLIWYFALNYTYAVHYHGDRTIGDYVDLACEEIADKNICIISKIKHLYNK